MGTDLINIAQHSLLNAIVLDDFSQNSSVTTTNDQDLLRVGVRVHGQVCYHLLVCKLIALGALDDIIEDENDAVVSRLEDQDVLIFGFLVVEDILDFEGHGLAWPHVGDLAEPSICVGVIRQLRGALDVDRMAG